MKDEWVELEQKWDELVKSGKDLEPEVTETVHGAKIVLQEQANKISQQLSERYKQIKESLKQEGNQ